MSNYTKGNWVCGEPIKGESDLMVYCDDDLGQMVADCTNRLTDYSREERAANARLISAAPDLLAALKLFLAHDQEPECTIWRHIHQLAHAAISKATGE